MVKIGILGVNDAYNNEDWYINNFSFKNVKDNITDFKQEEVNLEKDIFSYIQQYIKPNESTMMNITDLYYDCNYVIQTIYECCETEGAEYNALGSQLIRDHKAKGFMLLIKRKIYDGSQEYIDFSFDDLYKLIRSTFVHNAIVIHSNGNIEEFPFINDVLESVPDKQTFETIRYHEYKFIDYTMFFYCDITAKQTDDNLNQIASVIYRKKIYGRVFITLIDNNDDNPKFLDLDENIIKQIYHLHLIEEELDHTKYSKQFNMENNNFPQINYDPNFFSIINKEYELKKNSPKKTNPFLFNHVLNDIK
jgi:hypothetical protein